VGEGGDGIRIGERRDTVETREDGKRLKECRKGTRGRKCRRLEFQKELTSSSRKGGEGGDFIDWSIKKRQGHG
jgi:hypothetical protein